MKFIVTPDGVRYLKMAKGERQPMPFHLRWLLPKLLRESGRAWIVVTLSSIVLCSALVSVLALQRGASVEQSIFAGLLWILLPSTLFLMKAPVLVDAAGMACALGGAALFQAHPILAAVAVGIGACAWERTPIFAALFAWCPWLLAWLAIPVLRGILVKPGDVDRKDKLADTMNHPFRTGLSWHQGKWRDPFVMVLPWGVCLASLASFDLRWMVPVAVAYTQLLFATDSVRLYQQAAPAVCIAAAFVIPEHWMLAAIVAHAMNPWKTNGI